ncbi:hypothetical protein BCR35DRAFT_267549 [Leucosporidium creatinivorum]|uniref:BTB domain-containing protein n=1 Tax=Leucosporidium creatinivorum TaxID=106004 RepID=A0A1Y2EZW5_9BASI|nr:hypothetical protein BCR35DRAFT_267549 [Leucosporidium creatinivorum]
MDPGSAWANLTSQTRRTKGDVPPPLVGASVTTLGDAIYVFGGRPVSSREMISSLYRLNLRTLFWDRISPSPHSGEDEHDARPSPAPRYFHSAAAWEHRLVFYGGQGFVPPTSEEEEGHLETLDDVLLYDTVSGQWSAPSLTTRPGVAAPPPRYAHLSVVTSTVSEPTPGFEQDEAIVSSRLTIIGGQDWDNQYLAEMSVLDLDRMEWIAEASFDRRAGTYRSVGVAPSVTVEPAVEAQAVGEPVVRSSYSIPISEEKGEPVMVFSNTNFVNPRRELDFIPSPVESLARPPYFSVADRMIGDAGLPPGIRFPQAYACGRHLIVSGLNVATPISEYAIWSLDLGASGASGAMENDVDLRWSSIAAGNVLSSGSWNRAVGWKNNLVILGSKDRDILEDYNHRQNNFAHVAFVDLEAFGIYEPPAQQMTPGAQALGLVTFSQESLADYEVVANDGERVRCSRKLLESRWKWFHEEMEALESKARNLTDSHGRTETLNDEDEDDEAVDPRRPQAAFRPASRNMFRSSSSQSDHHSPSPSISTHPGRSIFPISLRSLTLPLDAPAARALVQYFYTLSLSTPLQRSVNILTTLLMFTKTHDVIPGLRALVVHALHESIDSENAPRIYESAALAGSVALQVSALRSMMAVSLA